MTLNDRYIIKAKCAGLPSARIGAKLSMSAQEVDRRWTELQQQVQANRSNGYEAAMAQFTILCHKYQLLGEELKVIAQILGNQMMGEDLQRLVVEGDQAQTLQNLQRGAIVLYPFVPTEEQTVAYEEAMEAAKPPSQQ